MINCYTDELFILKIANAMNCVAGSKLWSALSYYNELFVFWSWKLLQRRHDWKIRFCLINKIQWCTNSSSTGMLHIVFYA